MMMSITFIESERACYATFSFPDPPFSFLSVIREKIIEEKRRAL